MVAKQIGPVVAVRPAIAVERLPETWSGKILRGTMRAIADGKAYGTPARIDDPVVLDEMATALKARGLAGAA